ncbi:MAG TPA: S8 family serine peptidase [Polyangiaceae bacterium]|nr:S8 family serine peptidase [Polyangiaceae bacterium]
MRAFVWRVTAIAGLCWVGACGADHEQAPIASPTAPTVPPAPPVPPARAQPPLQLRHASSTQTASNQDFQPGELIVKYASNGAHAVTQDVEQWVGEGKSFGSATADGSTSLDALHQTLGVRAARSFLPGRRGLSTSEAMKLFALRGAGGVARALKAGLPTPARDLRELANVYVVSLPADADVKAAAERAKRDPHVEYAQPNYVVKADFTPNDPYFSTSGSWGQPFDDLWALKRINLGAAWDISQGDGVLVAVVDTGLDMTHPDIAANVWKNPAEIAGNGVDDDGNGLVDDVNGWNFGDGNADATDLVGHGTHVSGTIAAVGDNGVGVVGVAPHAKVLPVRSFDASGYAAVSTLAQGLVYAAQTGARVINNSWGCIAPCPSNPIVEEAVDVAVALGSTVVFSAGNSDHDLNDYSPQNRPNVIVVGASDPSDLRVGFSNFGALDVLAPGSGPYDPYSYDNAYQGILSLKSAQCSDVICPPELVIGDRYLRQAGTSMAAPHVTGLAALIIAQHPEYAPDQVRQVIRQSALDVGVPGYDTDSGHGRVDAAAALAVTEPLTVVISAPSGIVSAPGVVTVTGSASGPGFARYRLEVGTGLAPADYTLLAESTTPVTAGTLGTWEASSALDGTYTLRLQVVTNAGVTYEDVQPMTFERLSISEPVEPFIFKENTLIYRAGTVITVRGTAALGNRYDLTVTRTDGTPLRRAKITVPNGGRTPVVDDVLGMWDTSGVPTDGYDIVLTVRTTAGETETDSVAVVVDPTLHPGWPLNPLGIYTFPNLTGGVTAADLDGDGADEIAFVAYDGVTFYTHEGTELAGWPQSVDHESCYYGCWVNQIPVVADVTGDLDPEVLIANDSGELFVWKANGEVIIGPAPIDARYLAVDDMDGDGINDIVATGFTGAVRVWHADSGALELAAETIVSADPMYLSPPALGDVDGDGTQEIAVAVSDWYYYAETNLYVVGPGGVLPGWPRLINEVSSTGVTAPVLGDLDGDGDVEVVMSSVSGKVFAFQADGRRVTGWPRQAVADVPMNGATLGDFDGDGKLDVVAGTTAAWIADAAGYHPEASLFAWHGNGRKLSGFPLGYPVPPTDGFAFYGFGNSALADIDGDGEVEALTSTDGATDPFRALTAVKPDGSITRGFPKLTSSFGAYWTYTSAIADFDGDQQLELAFIDTNGLIYLWDLDSPVGAPRPWPMYQHDAQHTARADAPASGLRARLRGGLGSASDARIEAQIRLLNDSGRDVPLSELTLRYWYTDETTPSAQVFELGAATDESNDRTIRADRITSSFARVDRPKADRYVEVGFTSRAGKVRAESGVALDFTVRPQGRGRYDESNDYSYRRAPREADWKRVTLYRHGTLVWGTEP